MPRYSIAVIMFAVSTLVTAQSPSVRILRAEWGAGWTWMDVTQRVQSIVDARQSSFRVDADTLGNDPLPGTQKTLRVRLRSSNGQTQSFEYRDLETVSLRSWGIGDRRDGASRPGGGWNRTPVSNLRIVNAQYGDGRRQTDVTSTLARAVQGNALSIQVTNQNMGGDPAPAVVKRLTVQYEWQGQSYNVTIPENEWLRIPDSTGGYNPPTPVTGLRIVQASYGEGSRQLDVTSRIQSAIQNDRVSLRASNDNMGGDPARGADKVLTVIYEWQGTRYESRVNEDNTLTIPRSGDRVVGTGAIPAPAVDSAKYFDRADQVWKIKGDGVCFYRQTYFKGDAVCVRSGQELPSIDSGSTTEFLSVRFFGSARQVQVWNQTNFSGRNGRFTRDVTDMGRSGGGFGGSIKDIGSVRVE